MTTGRAAVNSTRTDQINLFEILLQRPNFTLLWIAKTISRVGDRLTQVALGAYALQLGEGAAVVVAMVTMISLAPHFLFGWALGVIIDRVDKKRAMIACDLLRGVLILSIPFVGRIEWVLIVGFLVGTLSALFGPALMASVPETVKPRELMGANSLVSLSNAAIDVAGFAAAGLVVALAGVRMAFALDFATFVVSAFILSCVTVKLLPVKKPGTLSTFIPSLLEGLRYQRRNATLNSLLVLVGIGCLAFGSINALGFVAVDRLLRLPAESTGWLLCSQGLAMLIASVVMTRYLVRWINKSQMISLGFLFMGVALFIISFNTLFYVSIVAYFILGLGNILFLIPTLTWVQEISPLEMRGRLVSIRNVVTHLGIFIAMGTAGVLADVVGITPVLMVAAILTIICAVGPRLLPGLWDSETAEL